MPVEAFDVDLGGWVLVQLGLVVLDVAVVANSEEFLVVLVTAGEQHSCDTDDIVGWDFRNVRRASLIHASVSGG